MGFFRKRQDQHPGGYALPPDTVERVAGFGRYEVNPEGSGEQGEEQGRLMIDLYPFASAEPERFMADLADAVLPVGGWAVYGASRVIWELVDPPDKQHPAYKAIMDGAIAFLRSNGVPPMRVRGYEWQYWLDNGGTRDTWLPRRPIPSLAEASITELQPGELRRVAQITSQPDSNVILVQRRDGGRYSALIDAKQSDDDPTRTQWEWKSADSLYDLYVEIGLSMQTPTYWYDLELVPYFPLSEPKV